jgi:signal transduction histidine kinase
LPTAKGGLGIGLALVKQLVEMHQGRVEAHSELGQGSEFGLTLPAAQSAEQVSGLVHRTEKYWSQSA